MLDVHRRILSKTKHNADKILHVSIKTVEALDELRLKYHKYAIQPMFMHRLLQDKPSRHREAIRSHPEIYNFAIGNNNEDDFVLIPNALKSDHEKVITDCLSLKLQDTGLILVGYYVHKDQLKDSVFNNADYRVDLSSRLTNIVSDMPQNDLRLGSKEEQLQSPIPRSGSFSSELERSGDELLVQDPNYLVTIADLKQSDIGFLMKVKIYIFKQLQDIYGVNIHQDKIEIFFHFPTAPLTSTLHIHARVNAPEVHPIESSTRYNLDDIIECLSSGKNISDLILARDNIYKSQSEETEDMLQDIDGIELEVIENPRKIYSDEMHITSKQEFDLCKEILEVFFTAKEIDYLYSYDQRYSYSFITKDTLITYLSEESCQKILANESFFFDLNNNKQIRGRFERQFADKFMNLLQLKGLHKKTDFEHDNIKSQVLEYKAEFATDKDYDSGIMCCVGEIVGNCESLGKNSTDYILYDMLMDRSRRLFIKCNGVIVGQSLLFMDESNKTLVISSLACIPSVNHEKTRLLIEQFAISLLKANPQCEKVVIGIGGRNFVTMNANDLPSKWSTDSSEQTATWKAWQRTPRVEDPQDEDLLSHSQAIGFSMERESNQTIRIQDEALFHLTPRERWDSFRVATVVDKGNIEQREVEVAKGVDNLVDNCKQSKLTLDKCKSNNDQKHAIRQIEFMRLAKMLLDEKFSSCCVIEEIKTQGQNKKYSSFAVTGLDLETQAFAKKELLRVLNKDIVFTDKPILQDDISFKQGSCLNFSIQIDLLGFSGKNLIDNMRKNVSNHDVLTFRKL